jgi:hypothetical protein
LEIKTHKSGKKHRKYGRSSRRPSHHRYNLEQRWIKNKARRIKKHNKAVLKKLAKKLARMGI